VEGVDAESLNQHYARISTDAEYSTPFPKSTASPGEQQYITEWQVFRVLDHLRHTATGLDRLPARFLRLGAPVFYKPITRLFNLSIATYTTPQQWKRATIMPVPKKPTPKEHADFRPISITPVLTRILERIIVQQFIYPAIQSPPATLSFDDQYAFRPTGSPTAAIISLLHTVTNMLTSNPYVIVLSLDFSKAFDTVRHSTLMKKLAQLDLPDTVYNWLTEFFSGHTHCTTYQGQTSSFESISASIIQGSGIGPATYTVNAADLNPVTHGNQMIKFADDTYIVIPAVNVSSRQAELSNVETWARANNLKVNPAKYSEVVFFDKRRKTPVQPPPPIPGIERTTTVKILGVTITNSLSVSEHIRTVISSCAQTMYAMKVLRAHGMDYAALQTIYQSVVIAKLQYASSAWWGFTTASDRQRLEAFIRRSARCNFVPADLGSFEELCRTTDERLFDSIAGNKHHVLHHLLPPKSDASQCYNLRPRTHNFKLPERSTRLTDCSYIERMLFKDIY